MSRVLILLLCSVPAILAQCNLERAQPLLKRAVYEFSVELSLRIAQEHGNHFVASTLSPWALLAGASLGAEGTTLAELSKVLRLHKHRCFNERYFELIKHVNAESSDVALERSSVVFVDRNLQIGDEFRRRIQETGVNSLVPLPFDNVESTAAAINGFVAHATHDTVLDVVAPSDLDNVYLAMVDAIYFKGMWQLPFPYDNTEVKEFFSERGDLLGNVNLMAVTGAFNYSSVPLLGADVLELPYGASGRYAMLVFLPDRDSSLSGVVAALKRVSLTTIYAIFEQTGPQVVQVDLPRFKIESDLNNLKDLLSDMGLRAAFDSQAAEFPYISDFALYISTFVQKANMEVTEEGSVASAATAALFGARSGPERFVANSPFFYMIVDKETQLPLFTGAYSKPSLY